MNGSSCGSFQLFLLNATVVTRAKYNHVRTRVANCSMGTKRHITKSPLNFLATSEVCNFAKQRKIPQGLLYITRDSFCPKNKLISSGTHHTAASSQYSFVFFLCVVIASVFLKRQQTSRHLEPRLYPPINNDTSSNVRQRRDQRRTDRFTIDRRSADIPSCPRAILLRPNTVERVVLQHARCHDSACLATSKRH